MPKRTPTTARGSRRSGSNSKNKRLKAKQSPSNKNKLLDYDSDDEPPADERLDWRQNPEDSLSDWTIEIIVVDENSNSSSNDKKNGSNTLFHVHKVALAVGARKCEYFGRLFLGAFSESQNACSRIELHPLAAAAFPNFLDYVYFDDLSITTENATSLHYLGRYFENRRLRWEAKQFWKRDMTMESMGTYYAHAAVFHDDKITDAVVEMCALQTDKITADLSIIQTSTPQLWLDVMQRVPSTRSRNMSNVLANFCATHAASIDMATFRELTSPTNLPDIDAPVALSLIDLERKLAPPTQAAAAPAADLPSNNDNNALSDLQQRCLTSLYSNWNTAHSIVQNQDGIQDSLRQQSPNMLVHLLASAQSDVLEVNKRLEEAQGDLIRMQDELAEKDKEMARQRRMQMLAAASRHNGHSRGSRFFPGGGNFSEGSAARPLELSGEEQADDDDDGTIDSDASSMSMDIAPPRQRPRVRVQLPPQRAHRRWLELLDREIDDSDSDSSSSNAGNADTNNNNNVNPANGEDDNDNDEEESEEEASVSSLESVGTAESAGTDV